MGADAEKKLEDRFVVAAAVPIGGIVVDLEPNAGELGGVKLDGARRPPRSFSQLRLRADLFETIGKEFQHVVAGTEPPTVQLVDALEIEAVLVPT